ncbi:MAG: hypothetical protein B7Z26_01930 [Asticcacaulis sp. 32-58-5]|nr:MAG: hypothetical protein B7Z26_01930 [Asticcacaulis sp. 32-58-5]
MSRENGNGAGGTGEGIDRAIELGIDSLAQLRSDMREAGMLECAEILDEAFVKCLKAYVDRRASQGARPSTVDDEAKGQAE